MMALPSSPPRLSSEEPPSSPLLPTLNDIDISFPANAGRKRLHSDYGSLSSDPLFSEDASELEFNDEGEQPKRKRLFKGPWWDVGRRPRQSLRKNMMKKEGFRNVDSGVWMGSDGSSEDSVPMDSPRMKLAFRDETVKQQRPQQGTGWSNNPVAYADAIVQGCLEHGKETIDLSGIGLTTLSNATLCPLHQMIKHVHDDLTQPPSEDLFAPLTPSLQLILSGNLLTSLPPELFTLQNIMVLSLRNNSLQEIPTNITRLPKLAELNIAGNQLSYLPWELLHMLRSTESSCSVSLRPNPFNVPRLSTEAELPSHTQASGGQAGSSNAASALRRQLEMRFIRGRQALNGGDEDATPKKKRNSKEQLIFLAPSRIIFRESDGAMARSELSMAGEEENAWEAPVLGTQYPPRSQASTTAPSLFELALRSAQLSYDLRDVSSNLSKETPPTVCRALEKAAKGVEYGNERCTTCSQGFVVARAEWLEYWFHGHEYYDLSEEKILPFKRKACSWNCAQATAVGTAYA
jgi:ribosomal protein S27AE